MYHHLTESIEDYLKAIYNLSQGNERVSTNNLAEVLDIKPASVTGMLKKLAVHSPSLVDYQSHKGVLLTDEGRRMALETLRHHRLLETFLVEIVGYHWEEVDEEAERLEHFISEKLENRIEELLGFPSFDPHGHPIPDRSLKMPDCSKTRLADMKKDLTVTISRVSDHDSELLKYLREKSLIPGAAIKILDYSTFDENHTIEITKNKERIVIGKKITRHIFVDQIESTERKTE